MTKGDKLLIVFLVLSSLVSFWIVKEVNSKIDNRYISIQIDGEEVERLEFNTKEEFTYKVIETKFGRNRIEIAKDYVRVVEADCPDKLDVLQGKITRPGEVIVCLPNRLVIEVKGEAGTGPIVDDTVR